LTSKLLRLEGLGVRVKAVKSRLVDERVLLLGAAASIEDNILGGTEDGLDLIGVDDASDIGVRDFGGGEDVVTLEGGNLVEGAVDLIKESEGRLSPDDEAAKVATRCKLEEVQSSNIDQLDTRQVAECLHQALVLTVDNKGSTALTVATVAELTLTSAKLAGSGDFDNIIVGTKGLEESNGLLGLGVGLDSGGYNKGNLVNVLDAMSTSKDKGRKGRSSKGGNDSETALVLVDLDVPLAPGLGGSEHTSTTAHVTEGSLTSTVGTGATNTGDTSDSTTSTPRLSTGLVASLLAHSVRLTLVLGDALVHLLHNIETDGGREDGGKSEGAGCLATCGVDANGRARGHFS
jgi:hypothetical protein